MICDYVKRNRQHSPGSAALPPGRRRPAWLPPLRHGLAVFLTRGADIAPASHRPGSGWLPVPDNAFLAGSAEDEAEVKRQQQAKGRVAPAAAIAPRRGLATAKKNSP